MVLKTILLFLNLTLETQNIHYSLFTLLCVAALCPIPCPSHARESRRRLTLSNRPRAARDMIIALPP
jgi:hypothetical protein